MAPRLRRDLLPLALLCAVAVVAPPEGTDFLLPGRPTGNVAFQTEQALAQRTTICGHRGLSCDFKRDTLKSRVPSRAHATLVSKLLTELSSRQVLLATSAGVVASVVMALLSSVLDPMEDRVLVRRDELFQAARVRNININTFFEINLCTKLIKFPIFEPLLVWVSATKLLPGMSPAARAALAGVAFATVTLPFTNYRFRVSMPTSSRVYRIGPFKAYLPTVARDVAYAIARISLPAIISSRQHPQASPEVLFASVFGACLCAAPLNELRGFALQTGNRFRFREFFAPLPFVRSIFLGAIRSAVQAASLVIGYRYAPQVVRLLKASSVYAKVPLPAELGIWALCGVAALALLLTSLMMSGVKRMGRSQPELLKDMISND